jgi:enamine deaminase RidA (YjgF/YER057c/UK114 family)
MNNLDLQLRVAGATWDDVVYRRMFVLDVDEFIATFRDPAVPQYGDGRPPARWSASPGSHIRTSSSRST